MTAEERKLKQHKSLHKNVVEELWHKGNLDVLDEHLHPTYASSGQAAGMDLEAIKDAVRMFREAFPDIRFTIHRQVAEGDDLVTFSTMSGTHRGHFRGIAPSGNRVQVNSTCHSRFQDGKLVEENVMIDQLGILKQLDVQPERIRELW